MDTPIFKQCVELWQGAGSNPYEVLIEQGVYQNFVNMLENSIYDISNNPISEFIYRGLYDKSYEVGDIIEFEFPHSWTEYYETASDFKGDKGVILRFSPKQTLRGIFIGSFNCDFYDEEEIILCPLKLKVTKVIGDDVYVEQVF
jgi:hypothetical protein